MTTITDKLRKQDFEKEAPNIKPTLKNSIYDFKPDHIKNFEKSKASYLDKDYKDGYKAKEFKKANIDVLEDTGIKNISGVSFNEDPFGAFFGIKSEAIPNRHLDGYYQYNLKGMTNDKVIKDRLLAQGGDTTDLGTRLQDQEEFLEILRRQREIEGEPLQRELEKERQVIDEGSGDEGEKESKFSKRRIEVQKAVRQSEEVKGPKEAFNKTVNEIRKLKLVPTDNLEQDLIKTFSILQKATDAGLGTTGVNTLNKLYKKYNLPQITPKMPKEQLDAINEKNGQFLKTMAQKQKEESIARTTAKGRAIVEHSQAVALTKAKLKTQAEARAKAEAEAKAGRLAKLKAETDARAERQAKREEEKRKEKGGAERAEAKEEAPPKRKPATDYFKAPAGGGGKAGGGAFESKATPPELEQAEAEYTISPFRTRKGTDQDDEGNESETEKAFGVESDSDDEPEEEAEVNEEGKASEADLNKVIIRPDASQADIRKAISTINSVLTHKAKGRTKLTKAEFVELQPFDTIFVKGGITKGSTIKTLNIKRQKLESLL